MTYKYEKENKEAVMINQPKANKELQEVYNKANNEKNNWNRYKWNKKSFSDITDYKVIVIENINDINYL